MKETRRLYLVIIRRSTNGYGADAPDVPGCIAVARTVEKVRTLMAEALFLHLEMMEESGEAIPESRSRVEIAVDDEDEGTLYTWIEVGEPMAEAG